MMTDDQAKLRQKLYQLQVEHRDLDDIIKRFSEDPSVDQFQLMRLKKRKLVLKDAIAQVEDQIVPDILA